jgi:hypothetical protein
VLATFPANTPLSGEYDVQVTNVYGCVDLFPLGVFVHPKVRVPSLVAEACNQRLSVCFYSLPSPLSHFVLSSPPQVLAFFIDPAVTFNGIALQVKITFRVAVLGPICPSSRHLISLHTPFQVTIFAAGLLQKIWRVELFHEDDAGK